MCIGQGEGAVAVCWLQEPLACSEGKSTERLLLGACLMLAISAAEETAKERLQLNSWLRRIALQEFDDPCY